MDPLAVRPYRRDDRAACLALFEGNIPGSFRPYEAPAFLEFLDRFTGPYLVVEQAGLAVACGGLAAEADFATLCWGMVVRERQRQGIGRFLLRTRLALAVDLPGVRRVTMNTSQVTAAFFAKEGFETLRVTPDGYGPGLDRYDMELRLGSGTRGRIHEYGRRTVP